MPLLKPPLGQAELQRDHPLAQGLITAILANEGAGLTLWDMTGNGRKGTLVGASAWAPGRDGYMVSLPADGASEITYRAIQAAEVPGPYSWSMTVRSPNVPGATTSEFLHNGDAMATRNFSAEWGRSITGNRCSVRHSVGGTDYRANFGYATIAANQWYVLTAVYDGGYLLAYRDGVLMGTSTAHSGPVQLLGVTGTICVKQATYQMDFGQFLFWSRGLTATEVAQHYLDPYAMFRERRRWWMFGQTAGGISVPWHLLQGRAA